MAATTKPLSSQEIVEKFWKTNIPVANKLNTKPPYILPSNIYAQKVRQNLPKGEVGGRSVTASYEEAVNQCEDKVAQIVAECRRNNKKYSDPHFDLEDSDCRTLLSAEVEDKSTDSDDQPQNNTVQFDVTQRGTSNGGPISWGNIQPDRPFPYPGDSDDGPPCVKRVGDIFDNPKFYVGGASITDTRQGAEGDCWFISAIGSLCVKTEISHLVEKVCPERARDEKCGVYGFVFNRDGEWISEIVDDKLYLSVPDYDDCDDDKRSTWDQSHYRMDPEVSQEEFRKTYQRNSDALYYASCASPDETWVPLLEKAFAKAHGDYKAIAAGYPGEGVEDLTGGISTEIVSADILDKDLLWTEGLLKVNKEFLFGAGTKNYKSMDWMSQGRQGIEDGHAYTVLRAVNYGKWRLLLVKNPWGRVEWNGPWSDGSKEWTPEALKELDFKFGNDGIFWMPYEDFLRRYAQIYQTRLFTPDWNVSQRWTTIQVPWSGDYNDTKFEFTIPKSTRAVIVLSKLDDRYFRGLMGQYGFNLAFRLHRSGEDMHIVRGYSSGDRSASTELELEAGTYDALLQISSWRDSSAPKIESVVKQNWISRREKLIRTGLSYDLAHAKGQIEEEEKKIDDTTTAPAKEGETSKVPKPSEAAELSKNTEPLKDAELLKDSKPSSDTGSAKDAAVVSSQPPVGTSDGGSTGSAPNTTPPSTAVADDVPTDQTPSDADPAPKPDSGESPAENEEPLAEEPWNATCVIGLRVFCQETAATIRVVRPDAEGATADTKTKLDIDDPEKDAVGKGDKKEVESEAKKEV